MWIEMTRLDGYAMLVRPEHISCMIDYPGKHAATAVYLVGHSESIFVTQPTTKIRSDIEKAAGNA